MTYPNSDSNLNQTYDKEAIAKRLAALSQEPQIYVVPDDQMPQVAQYGGEVPILSTKQNLQSFTGAIRGQQAKNPVYMPFPAGAPTMQKQGMDEQKRQFDQGFAEQQRQFDMTFPLEQAKTQYAINKPYYSPNTGGGGSAAGYPGGVTKATSVNNANKTLNEYANEIKAGRLSVSDAVKNIYDRQQLLWNNGVDANDLARQLGNLFGYQE